MAKDLTVKALEHLKPGPARQEVPDGHTRGLYFILQPSGLASWAYRYRFGPKLRKLTLGNYPEIDLPTARKIAAKAAQSVAMGEDPAEMKKAAKKAAEAPSDLYEDVVEKFIELYLKINTRPGTCRVAIGNLKSDDFLDAWKGRSLSTISRADVYAVLDEIVKRGAPVQANRSLSIFRQMCSWAVGRDIIVSSPCDRVVKLTAEKSRDRALEDDEIKLVWSVFEDDGWPFGYFGQMLFLTVQREAEVAGMQWSEINLATKTWLLPKERSKNGIANEIALSEQAIALLQRLPRVQFEGRSSPFVFTTTGRSPISGFSRAKERFDRKTLAALKKAAKARGEDPEHVKNIAHWTWHDLRRTATTGMAALGVPPHIADAILNHTSGTITGVAAIYNRFEYIDERRLALYQWSHHVEKLITGKSPAQAIPCI